MTSADLTATQAKIVYLALRPAHWYLAKLQQRMAERDFPPTDRLLIRVKAARRAMDDLCEDLHFVACNRGTWGG
jgi:hypothetical protein